MSILDKFLMVFCVTFILGMGYAVFQIANLSSKMDALSSQMALECSDAGGVNVLEYRSSLVCYNQETGARIIVPSEIIK